MYRHLIYILIFSISSFVYADWFKGYYITLDNDTIEGNIEIPVNKISKKLAISSIQKKINIASNGEMKKFKSGQIQGFFINDFGGIQFKSLQINDKKILFLQVVAEGKINLYKFDYLSNAFETPSDAIVDIMFGDSIPYFVQMDDKNILFCRSLNKFLEYVDNDFFDSRYETIKGHWGSYIEDFVIEFNTIK